MNTKGHANVAKTAGLPLLKQVFGEEEKSLEAMYLGNWLTDVSQTVDPVAYWGIGSKGKKILADIGEGLKKIGRDLLERFKRLPLEPENKELIEEIVLKPLGEHIAKEVEGLQKRLEGAIDYFLLAGNSDERLSQVADFFRSCFLVVGYFKFVHPKTPGGSPRMSFNCFMKVFGRRTDTRGAAGARPADDRPGSFSQYFPHEHLDRPEILPPEKPPLFAHGVQLPGKPNHLAPPARTGTRSPHKPTELRPDLYSYLRDAIEMTAGLLAEVDQEMAAILVKRASDDPQAKKSLAEDEQWHLTLAKLGHALHQVEDFFAHSNWMELAVLRLGPDFLAKVFPQPTKIAFLNRSTTIFRKRLKRLLTEPLENWHSHEEENWVVTGFFDVRDTFISLGHVAEELLGVERSDPSMDAHGVIRQVKEAVEEPEVVLAEVQKKIRDTLDFITEPDRAMKDSNNDTAKWLQEEFRQDIEKLSQPEVSRNVAEAVARELPHLRDAPAEVQKAFFDVIVLGSRAQGEQSLYKSIRTIADFFANPYKWLQDLLPEKLKEWRAFYAIEQVYDVVGKDRIGCHSLMAKDSEPEPLFELQKECATAVHFYIVQTLLRWKDPERRQLIDWLELLEFFLRNPLPGEEFPIEKNPLILPDTIIHVTKEREQLDCSDPNLSLTKKYLPNALVPSGWKPGDPPYFTWRTIADANYATEELSEKQAQKVINATLEHSGGVKVAPPNYAFKPGMYIRIPGQKTEKAELLSCEPKVRGTEWFEPVLDKGWKVFQGYEDDKANVSVPAIQPHTPIIVSKDLLLKFISYAKEKRSYARAAYRPPQGG